MKNTNRVLSIFLLIAGLGLLYQAWNDKSLLMIKVNEILPKDNGSATGKTRGTEQTLNISVGNQSSLADNGSSIEASSAQPVNLGGEKLSLTSLSTSNPAPVIETSSSDAILKLKADCWLEIRDASQKVLVAGHNKKGKTFTLDRTKTPFTAKTPCKPENIDLLLDDKKKSFKFNKKDKSYLLTIDF